MLRLAEIPNLSSLELHLREGFLPLLFLKLGSGITNATNMGSNEGSIARTVSWYFVLFCLSYNPEDQVNYITSSDCELYDPPDRARFIELKNSEVIQL